MDDISRVSKVLYVGLCHEIGTPTELTIRRDVGDMDEIINKPVELYKGERERTTGSYREGFRFRSSDRDFMTWYCKHKLICDISQARLYDRAKHTIILMEDSDTPPGFVKLQLLTSPRDKHIVKSAILVNDRIYISSLLWQQQIFKQIDYDIIFQRVTSHGPCANAYLGSYQFDYTRCIAGTHWPAMKQPWIDRCLLHTWPPASVLQKILKDGYHCVPIASKIVSSGNLLEWRLSFSQAEQNLVSAMNHTQFLVYGLLKIFLKEIVNDGVEEPLLCSYFLKTTVFWMIREGSVEWRPNNLLNCFWMCFKYLIGCVYRGVLPNFFIPQNNIFINKVTGSSGEGLYEQLYQYYEMGMSCLLLSPTLRSILEPGLNHPASMMISFFEGHYQVEVDIDRAVYEENTFSMQTIPNLDCHFVLLMRVERLTRLSYSPHQTLALQYSTCEALVRTAFMVASNTSYYTHKNTYTLDRIVCNMLKLASRIGSVSHSLYLALYYYRTGRYNEALRVTYLTKQRLSQPYIMYHHTVDRQRYSEAVGGKSLSRKLKTAWVDNVAFYNEVHYIDELILEQEVKNQNDELALIIPPFVLTYMLLALSHYRLGNISQCLQSLTDLQTLFFDDDRYIPHLLRGLSWQILGICQHVVGDLHGALQSYQESLRHEQFYGIQTATEYRIAFVERQLHSKRPS